MSRRSKLMLQSLGQGHKLNCAESVPRTGDAKLVKKKGGLKSRNDVAHDVDDDSVSLTESELGLLNPTWRERHMDSTSETMKKSSGTPPVACRQIGKLVPYTPSPNQSSNEATAPKINSPDQSSQMHSAEATSVEDHSVARRLLFDFEPGRRKLIDKPNRSAEIGHRSDPLNFDHVVLSNGKENLHLHDGNNKVFSANTPNCESVVSRKRKSLPSDCDSAIAPKIISPDQSSQIHSAELTSAKDHGIARQRLSSGCDPGDVISLSNPSPRKPLSQIENVGVISGERKVLDKSSSSAEKAHGSNSPPDCDHTLGNDSESLDLFGGDSQVSPAISPTRESVESQERKSPPSSSPFTPKISSGFSPHKKTGEGKFLDRSSSSAEKAHGSNSPRDCDHTLGNDSESLDLFDSSSSPFTPKISSGSSPQKKTVSAYDTYRIFRNRNMAENAMFLKGFGVDSTPEQAVELFDSGSIPPQERMGSSKASTQTPSMSSVTSSPAQKTDFGNSVPREKVLKSLRSSRATKCKSPEQSHSEGVFDSCSSNELDDDSDVSLMDFSSSDYSSSEEKTKKRSSNSRSARKSAARQPVAARKHLNFNDLSTLNLADSLSSPSIEKSQENSSRLIPSPKRTVALLSGASTSTSSGQDKDSRNTEINTHQLHPNHNIPLGVENEALSDDDLQAHQVDTEKPETKSQMKKKRKLLRNSGKAYVNSKGALVSARKRQEPHDCSYNKCKTIITPEVGDQIFRDFWEELGDHDEQVKYVAARVSSKPTQRRRQRVPESGKLRSVTYEYTFEINGERRKVCKDTFLKTLDVSERFVREVMEKKASNLSGIVSTDGRGHHHPKHKLPTDTEAAIKAHINSFPSYVSHYSRSQSKTLYFPSHLSIVIMHRLYLEQVPSNPRVSYSVYREYVKATGKKFKKPPSDTCSTCDSLKMRIEVSTEAEQRSLKAELERHQRKADLAYAIKRRMKAESGDDTLVLVFDLEQCLPTPLLRCGEVYYLRQLYTYNLTVHDTRSKKTYCYMWHEGEGGRGANQIASCLLRHILHEVPDGIKRLVLFSDTCSGQNRNSHVAAMYLVALQEHPSLEVVEHIFLVPGHTHLEVDNKHSIIEKKKNQMVKISVPEEYYAMVHDAGNTDPVKFPEGKFKVVRMGQEFFDFAALLKGPLVKRDKLTSGQKFSWMKSHWFRYSISRIGIVEVKSALNPDALFDELSFLRASSRCTSLPRLKSLLEKCYHGPHPISVEKKKDLLSLLRFLDSKHHAFYQSLVTHADLADTDPDLPEEENEDDVQ